MNGLVYVSQLLIVCIVVYFNSFKARMSVYDSYASPFIVIRLGLSGRHICLLMTQLGSLVATDQAFWQCHRAYFVTHHKVGLSHKNLLRRSDLHSISPVIHPHRNICSINACVLKHNRAIARKNRRCFQILQRKVSPLSGPPLVAFKPSKSNLFSSSKTRGW